MEGNNHFKSETRLKLHHPVPSFKKRKKKKPIQVFLMHAPLIQKDSFANINPTL